MGDLLTQQVSPVSGTTVSTYNEHGELVTTTDARGIVTTRTVDAADRLTQQTFGPAGAPDPALTITYTYGSTPAQFDVGRLTGIARNGQTIAYTYDRFGRVLQDGSLIYGYDKNGNRSTITYPGGGDALTFVRGNEGAANTLPDVDWDSLARLDGTIVCYAGPDQLPAMLEALLSHGRPDDDTAALIYDGTLPTQQTTLGTLAEIARGVSGTAERRPAILVVGRVAALRDHLRWFDSRPLFGKRVLVTRPREQSAEFVSLLQALGADPIEAPMIRIAPPSDYTPLDDACQRLDAFDWVVFTSGNAVDAFMGRLLASPADVRALVDRVNAERTRIYAQRAREQNVPAGQVGRVYAAEIMQKAPPGTWFLGENGSYTRK